MQRYEVAKSLLFDWPTLSHAVINLDDAAGRRLIPRLVERGVDVIGYSTHDADETKIESPIAHRLSARAIRATSHGFAFEVDLDGHAIPIEVPLVGQFNVENLLGVLGVMHACGIDFARAVAALPQLDPPLGRMQQVVMPAAPLAVIDYAHTPDALSKALAALRPLVEARQLQGGGGKLWVVFGAAATATPASAHRWGLLPRRVPTWSSSPVTTHDRKTPKRSLRRSRPERQTHTS